MNRKRLLVMVLLGILLVVVAGCLPDDEATPSPEPISAQEFGQNVLDALAAKDMTALAGLVDPAEGVRFTPYLTVNTVSDVVLTADELAGTLAGAQTITWGVFDGSGEPMDMTFSDYLDRFVWDHDYRNAEQVGVNQTFCQGNSIDNSADVYPGATIVEYYFSGFDPQYAGMDWRALRLVLEEADGEWYLLGIIHGQWTI